MSRSPGMPRLSYSALESLKLARPVERVHFLAKQVGFTRVFDLGALDETAWQAKKGTSSWLHARLCEVATEVIGIDSSELVPDTGLETAPNGRIIRADICNLYPVIERYGRPDVIVAGELIEHLPDTLAFLRSLKKDTRLAGVTFVFSTPNACCWHNAIIGLAGRESMHGDHLQVYSYKTLRTLFDRADIELRSLQPTYARFPEMIAATSGLQRGGVIAFQRTVNLLEWAFPAMGAGWVGVATI